MKITKDNLLSLLDEMMSSGYRVAFDPDTNVFFPSDIDDKINTYHNQLSFINDNWDKPFTKSGGKVETLSEFFHNAVGALTLNPERGNIFSVKVPKNKEIDTTWLWGRINKLSDSVSKNIAELGDKVVTKLDLKKYGVNSAYGTSYGISIPNLWNSASDSTLKSITSFLDANDVLYDVRYSRANWNIQVYLSKSVSNLNTLKRALNSSSFESVRKLCMFVREGNKIVRKKI